MRATNHSKISLLYNKNEKDMEKVKGIFKHFLISEVIMFLLFILYLITNIVYKNPLNDIDYLFIYNS